MFVSKRSFCAGLTDNTMILRSLLATLFATVLFAGGHARPFCNTRHYRKNTLKLLREMPYVGLFEDVKGSVRFEASGMTVAKGYYWTVFDNMHALGHVNDQFTFKGKENILYGSGAQSDSQYEGLAYIPSRDHFLAVEEAALHPQYGLVPMIHELAVNTTGSLDVVRKCPILYTLTHENTGVEGLSYFEQEGREYILALCEGNSCTGGDKGEDPGHGRIILAQYQPGNCTWTTVKVIHVPETAFFKDYSGLAIRGDRVAIVSQENSALWVGHFDWRTLSFDRSRPERVFHFPRDGHCDIKYCTMEGVEWLDDVRLVFSSDKAKRNQPYRCTDKEQSLSIFALPVSDYPISTF